MWLGMRAAIAGPIGCRCVTSVTGATGVMGVVGGTYAINTMASPITLKLIYIYHPRSVEEMCLFRYIVTKVADNGCNRGYGAVGSGMWGSEGGKGVNRGKERRLYTFAE